MTRMGAYYRWNAKDTTEGCLRLSIYWIRRRGMLASGWYSLTWSRGGREIASIGMWAAEGRLVLEYRHRQGGGEWEDVSETVHLGWTPCHYGGRRPWLLCPRCLRMVGMLYASGRLFLCRHCYRLAYESQREDPMTRALSKAQGIRVRLGGSASMLYPFREKPKGMHWRTYFRLHGEAMEAEAAYASALTAVVDKAAARWGLAPENTP